jgi:hypothetical protein
MTYDDEDARREQWLLDLYEEHGAQALAEFRGTRLRSYYEAKPSVLQPPFASLKEARRLVEGCPSASHVLASAAAEVGLKAALLKPVIHGLVHSESMATYVTDLAVEQRDMRKFHALLFALLRDASDIDLTVYWRNGEAPSLWERFRKNASKRNRIVHQCEGCSRAEAQEAIEIATAFLDDLIPTVIANFDLHVHDDYRICSQVFCLDHNEGLHPWFQHA